MPGSPTDTRQALDPSAALATVPFREPETATQTFARLTQRIPPALAAAVPPLLTDTPDPDAALILFERLACESSDEVVRLLDRHKVLAHYAITVFGYSRFLGETLLHNTDLLSSLLREKNLDRSFSREEFHESLGRYRSRSFEQDIALLLARFKRREYVRILLRDALKIAPLAETTAELSALADVLIEDALREAHSQLQHRYPAPQHLDTDGRLASTPFTVLSLGKLGGSELNYNSDVDLLYLYGDGQEPGGSSISSKEYFVRLAQMLTEMLSRVTAEGPVFRIDLRLRPQGNEGELAVSLGQALRYYSEIGDDWERQALIKVRHSAGDAVLARQFIRGVQPHVYSERINFAAIKTALLSREKMHKHRRQAPPEARSFIDIKLDRGGIRDIEFLVQCLQRVYGGAEPWLRSGGTLFSLQKLYDKGHITGKSFHELNSTYEFLRHLEHRIQLRTGRQTHRLATAATEVQALRRAMARLFTGDEGRKSLVDLVQARMAAVAEIYNRVIYQQQARQDEQEAQSGFELRGAIAPARPDESNQAILERLAHDSPTLYGLARRSDLSPHVRRNLFRFLSSALTSSERYADVLQHADAVPTALALFATSDFLTDILVRHPKEIATLSRIGKEPQSAHAGYLFGGPLRNSAPADPILEYVATAPVAYSEKLGLLRQHYRHCVFRSGARDITEMRDVYESLAATTVAADDAIVAAFGIAGQPLGLAVMALGRLGTGDFDLLSDADILFVSEESCDRQALSKAAELIMHTLAAYTRDGMVFPVDARLRPRGEEGELLITPSQLEAYFEQEAQPWEALVYTKLRFVAGSLPVAERATEATRKLFARFAADPGFAPSVREMRRRLEDAEAGEPSFKGSPGGVYDIDFIVSSLLVKSELLMTGGNLRDRLWRCAAEGILGKVEAASLDHAGELFRTVEHVVRLVDGRRRKWLPRAEHGRRISEELTSKILRREFTASLENELTRTAKQVRAIFEHVVS
jgi:[glutamine synthetase] adenylyltransferase / [glutamine synthetase]-adenylyl-L-tyrosine phosphorylase